LTEIKIKILRSADLLFLLANTEGRLRVTRFSHKQTTFVWRKIPTGGLRVSLDPGFIS
jgi:hypothetical protein